MPPQKMTDVVNISTISATSKRIATANRKSPEEGI